METQATDAENAAFVVFVVLVTRVILAFDLNLYIPLSKVDENMKRAHSRDAVHQQKVRSVRSVRWDEVRSDACHNRGTML